MRARFFCISQPLILQIQIDKNPLIQKIQLYNTMEQESLKDIPQQSQNQRNSSENLIKTEIQCLPILKKHKMRGPPKGSKRRPNTAAGIKSGLWNISQMKAYLKFIMRFGCHFKDKATRKKKKIFHRMSNFVKSRSAQQCRSHHQKLQLKFDTLQEIIQFIKSEITNILEIIARGNKDGLRFQSQGSVGIKEENFVEQVEYGVAFKQGEKKTDLRESQGFYEVNEYRNTLVINISEQKMQTWS